METDQKSSIYGVKGITILWAIFSLFILYATLIPFTPASDLSLVKSNISAISWVPFVDPDGTRASIPDMVQNILLFLPFGFLGLLAGYPERGVSNVFKVTALGLLLSFSVEILQLFTSNRTTSATDIVTNTIGTFAGAAFTASMLSSVLLLLRSKGFSKYRCDKYLALVVMSTSVVIAGALQPFDFSLDVGGVWSKLKAIKETPFSFDPVLRDEGVVALRMFLFGFVWSVWFEKLKFRYAVIKAFLVCVLISVAFEGAQLVVQSRMPGLQDVVVIVIGCSMGVWFSRRDLSRVSSTVWIRIILMATAISVAIQILSPFRLSDGYTAFNWFPFLAYYERTTFIALSNFIESMLMFFPMGFILQYFNPITKKSILRIGLLTVMIALPLELLQGWIAGRYPDVTDVLGALTGVFLAVGLCVLWYNEFNVSERVQNRIGN